ncbi:gustatory receptor for sugar taste 61a [Musca vetustissima]|uniref:gustatory receptor for sugar taste 61a n=1 Tax=Musca vetustissima TaxID=27455 RepID=UPI002AB68EAD|nr:gustatory receptor for sugar taste 61a [Musca vetustissima]
MTFPKDHWKVWSNLKLRRRNQKEILKKFTLLQRQQDFRSLDTFHRAVRPCLLVAQIFGLMPLVNSMDSNPYRLAFKIPCLAFTTTFLFLFFGSWKTLHVSDNLLNAGLNPKNIIGIVFFFMCMTVFLNFLSIARGWPQLIMHWTRIDLIFLKPPYQPPKRSLQKQLRTLTIVFCNYFLLLFFFRYFLVLMVLVENSLYYASHYYNFLMERLICHPEDTRHSYKEYLITALMSDVFTYFDYHIMVVICAFFINTAFTVTWNFMDFFIMAVSLGLATRFQQFADRIELMKGSYIPDALWNQIRQHHIQLCEFMEKVNEHLSAIVLISALNNMYFICNQLLNIFTKHRYPISIVYFWVALVFLLGHTCGVFMFASRIREASLLPLKILYLVPSGCWTEEVQRFMAQLLDETVGLTGKYFYTVTRQGFFGLMSTIVTYEFMLLQLDSKSREDGLPDLCA